MQVHVLLISNIVLKLKYRSLKGLNLNRIVYQDRYNFLLSRQLKRWIIEKIGNKVQVNNSNWNQLMEILWLTISPNINSNIYSFVLWNQLLELLI